MDTTRNRMLWWSLVVSLVIYVGVAQLAITPEPSDELVETLFPILAVLSIGVAVGSLVYRRHALVGPIQSGQLDLATRIGRQRAFQPFIVNLVLSESVGIYGLVLAFLSGNRLFAVGFAAAGLALLYLHRPTASDIQPPRSPHDRAHDPTPIG